MASPNPDIFRQVEPPDRLKSYVRRLFVADCHEPVDMTFRVRATGYCYLSCVWRGRWCGSVDGKLVYDTAKGGAVFCSGQIVDGHVTGAVTGRLVQVFVEFQALGQYQLLGIPGAANVELAQDPTIPNPALGSCLPGPLAAGADRSGEACLRAMIEALDDLAARAIPVPRALAKAIAEIERCDGDIMIAALCKEIGLSERSFRRDFRHLVGLGPKQFCRTLQVTKALNRLLEGNGQTLAQLSLKAGFSDQSHFTRSFQQFFGASPVRLSENVETTLKRFVGRSRCN